MARSSTERSRLHRARIAAGEICAHGSLPPWLEERLFVTGHLTDEASRDPRATLAALVNYNTDEAEKERNAVAPPTVNRSYSQPQKQAARQR